MTDLAARGRATEVRVTSSTGGAKGTKQAAFADIPAAALYEIAEHTGKGIAKYPNLDGIPNFRHGYEWSLSYAALMRHMVQFWAGEDMDEESGSKHVIAAAWHAINLATLMDEHRELDDRVTTVRARNAGGNDEVSKLRAVIQHAKDIWPSSDWGMLKSALGE